MITLMSVFLDEISVSLTVRRIIPAGSEIIRLARLDDVEGIKRLFSMGLASPNDSMESGQSVLFVRRIPIHTNVNLIPDRSHLYGLLGCHPFRFIKCRDLWNPNSDFKTRKLLISLILKPANSFSVLEETLISKILPQEG